MKTHPGATPSSLPDTGWYTWVWQITPDMQDANMKQYLSTDYDWSDNVLEAETTQHVRNMQPTITSSVSDAYKNDQSTVTGAMAPNVRACKSVPLRHPTRPMSSTLKRAASSAIRSRST